MENPFHLYRISTGKKLQCLGRTSICLEVLGRQSSESLFSLAKNGASNTTSRWSSTSTMNKHNSHNSPEQKNRIHSKTCNKKIRRLTVARSVESAESSFVPRYFVGFRRGWVFYRSMVPSLNLTDMALKIGGWKTILSFLGWLIFRGELLVSGSVAVQRSNKRKTCIREAHWKGLTFH